MAGFYLSSDGSCAQCPASESVWDRYGTLILLFICLAGFACLTVAIMGTVVILAGGRIKDLIASVIGLVVYLLTVVQVLSNVSQVNSARLPILLQVRTALCFPDIRPPHVFATCRTSTEESHCCNFKE